MSRQPIAVIGTGGTISSIGADSLDLLDYPDHGRRLEVGELLDRVPEAAALFDLHPVPFRAVVSSEIGPDTWHALATLITETANDRPDLVGFVVTHGTATLEETAYALSLVLKVAQPVVLVGAQRPTSAVSADGPANLLDALRVAASPAARGLGVLVVLNDEIHAAREVTKTSTYRLQTFRAPEFGPLGQVDGDGVQILRQPLRRHTTASLFGPTNLAALPRVDIAFSYAGADGAAIDAFVAAGAAGLVSAGFPPGITTPAEASALLRARDAGLVVVQGSRAVGGRVAQRRYLREQRFVAAEGLTPQKARVLLALSLTRTRDAAEVQEIFRTH